MDTLELMLPASVIKTETSTGVLKEYSSSQPVRGFTESLRSILRVTVVRPRFRSADYTTETIRASSLVPPSTLSIQGAALVCFEFPLSASGQGYEVEIVSGKGATKKQDIGGVEIDPSGIISLEGSLMELRLVAVVYTDKKKHVTADVFHFNPEAWWFYDDSTGILYRKPDNYSTKGPSAQVSRTMSPLVYRVLARV